MACLLLAFATFAQADDECLGCADRIKAAVDYCNVSIKSRTICHETVVFYSEIFFFVMSIGVWRSDNRVCCWCFGCCRRVLGMHLSDHWHCGQPPSTLQLADFMCITTNKTMKYKRAYFLSLSLSDKRCAFDNPSLWLAHEVRLVRSNLTTQLQIESIHVVQYIHSRETLYRTHTIYPI